MWRETSDDSLRRVDWRTTRIRKRGVDEERERQGERKIKGGGESERDILNPCRIRLNNDHIDI